MRKLKILAEIEGYDSVQDMIESAVFDSTAPGICKNHNCDFTTEVEPDQDAGYCENCHTNSVVSCLILAGI